MPIPIGKRSPFRGPTSAGRGASNVTQKRGSDPLGLFDDDLFRWWKDQNINLDNGDQFSSWVDLIDGTGAGGGGTLLPVASEEGVTGPVASKPGVGFLSPTSSQTGPGVANSNTAAWAFLHGGDGALIFGAFRLRSQGANQVLMDTCRGNTGRTGFTLQVNSSNNLQFALYDGAGSVVALLTSGVLTEPMGIHRFILRHRSGTDQVELYLDGDWSTPINTTTYARPPSTANSSDSFRICSLSKAASTSPIDGFIAEVGLVSDYGENKISQLGTYLDKRYGRTEVWLDTVAGSDSNDGLSNGAAKATLTAALTAAGAKGTIYITAPEATPALGFIQLNADLELLGYDGDDWYLDRAHTYTSGWSSEGGGVYSRTKDTGTPSGTQWVPSIVAGDGYATPLTQNTGTPTTPSAGEWGLSGGVVYVHLPGSVDPNLETVKITRTGENIEVQSGNVILENAIVRFSQNRNCINASGGALTAFRSSGLYASNSGFAGAAAPVNLYNCTGAKNGNDGFNVNAGAVWAVYNCLGEYNGDEGISPHVDAVLTIRGGIYRNNTGPGATSVGTSVMNIYEGALFDNNEDGVRYASDSSGDVDTITCSNNTDRGFNYTSTGTVTVANLTSGVGQGNGLDDVLPP